MVGRGIARQGKTMHGMLRHSKSRQAKVLHGLGFTKVTLLLFKKGEQYGRFRSMFS